MEKYLFGYRKKEYIYIDKKYDTSKYNTYLLGRLSRRPNSPITIHVNWALLRSLLEFIIITTIHSDFYNKVIKVLVLSKRYEVALMTIWMLHTNQVFYFFIIIISLLSAIQSSPRTKKNRIKNLVWSIFQTYSDTHNISRHILQTRNSYYT